MLAYVLHLADNALVAGHRNSEWTGHGPILEQDIALSNIALDLVGQARNLYQYAATIANDGSTEDSFAYLRDAREYKNCLLVEQPNGDWAQTITRQYFFSAFQQLYYAALKGSADKTLASIADKSLKEVHYHNKWSAEWIIRLGDGTEESHRRMNLAVNKLYQYTGELFEAAHYESELVKENIAVDLRTIKEDYYENINKVISTASLPLPGNTFMQTGGKTGLHTEHLGYLLAEMQFLQRAYPNANW
ncbi:MAG: 1,2-phenylacetyl-CoA epoxidase subunit PaaC [Flavitalea sp.]